MGVYGVGVDVWCEGGGGARVPADDWGQMTGATRDVSAGRCRRGGGAVSGKR